MGFKPFDANTFANQNDKHSVYGVGFKILISLFPSNYVLPTSLPVLPNVGLHTIILHMMSQLTFQFQTASKKRIVK